ncbi:MAG: molybdopterin-dependent oxidoreductase [Dehalococcoidia bacterium]|nr:molybdopterin-dependent oxidoreductase [Dehalococcoidia bacterium]
MEEFVTMCPFSGCHQDCVLKVKVKDGRLHKIESADIPGEPEERRSCLRGLSAIRWVYHPDRLKYPLKRAGERGEGKWQRISWDQALDEIAAKLLDIKDKYGPHAVKIMPGGSSSVGVLMGRQAGLRFANTWGAGGTFEGRGYTSDGGVPAACLLVLGDSYQSHDCRDYLNSKMVILWGGNSAETGIPEMKYYLNAQANGAKFVVIGPYFHATAGRADRWVPIKPATDTALALGMINVIIQKGLHDRDYISRYTVGPFLVRSDNGRFLREKEVKSGGSDRPMVWDGSGGRAVPHDTREVLLALEGSFTVNGIECRPAFQLLAERAAEYTPEKVAAITELPQETVVELAVEYATARPAASRMFYGMSRTHNSNISLRAIIILAAITGNIGVPGGGASIPDWSGHPFDLNNKGVSMPPGAPGQKILPGSLNSIRGWERIRKGEPYPIKALMVSYINLMQNYGNEDNYREIFSNMELIVASDVFMTWTNKYADYVLPEASVLERNDINLSHNHVMIMEKAIEPIYETRSALDIWKGLAERVGLGDYFKGTEDDYLRALLDSDDPAVAGITLERLKKEKVIRADVPLTPYVPFSDKVFPTDSGKIEIYLESMLDFGEELPFHRESLESPATELGKRYPLRMLSIKKKYWVHSQLCNVDWMQEMEPEPVMEINPVDARARGIGNGDIAEVFNDRGRAVLKASLTHQVPPGTINLAHGWWPDHYIEGHYACLLHSIDDLSIIIPSLEVEKVIKDIKGASHLIHYDCMAEVRKREAR